MRTDDGGVLDGAEDQNFNGYQDPGEIDPNVGRDDTITSDAFVAEGGGCASSSGGALADTAPSPLTRSLASGSLLGTA